MIHVHTYIYIYIYTHVHVYICVYIYMYMEVGGWELSNTGCMSVSSNLFIYTPCTLQSWRAEDPRTILGIVICLSVSLSIYLYTYLYHLTCQYKLRACFNHGIILSVHLSVQLRACFNHGIILSVHLFDYLYTYLSSKIFLYK